MPELGAGARGMPAAELGAARVRLPLAKGREARDCGSVVVLRMWRDDKERGAVQKFKGSEIRCIDDGVPVAPRHATGVFVRHDHEQVFWNH